MMFPPDYEFWTPPQPGEDRTSFEKRRAAEKAELLRRATALGDSLQTLAQLVQQSEAEGSDGDASAE
jgi:hypothetical protein